MLKPAQLYRDELHKKLVETWYDEKYKYFYDTSGKMKFYFQIIVIIRDALYQLIKMKIYLVTFAIHTMIILLTLSGLVSSASKVHIV